VEESIFSKPFRYETAIERQLYRALHQLERRQAAQRGAALTPAQVLDIEVRGSPKWRGAEIRDPQGCSSAKAKLPNKAKLQIAPTSLQATYLVVAMELAGSTLGGRSVRMAL
jgi:hypothetical protein